MAPQQVRPVRRLGPLAGGYIAAQTGVRSVFVISAVLLLAVTLPVHRVPAVPGP